LLLLLLLPLFLLLLMLLLLLLLLVMVQAATGGGITALDSGILLIKSNVTNNKAARDGGGLYLTSSPSSSVPASPSPEKSAAGPVVQPVLSYGNVISNNTAVAGVGGGVYAISAVVRMVGDALRGNVAGQAGGAVEAAAGADVNIEGCDLEGESALANGDGVSGFWCLSSS
jgi:hypothetical protein